MKDIKFSQEKFTQEEAFEFSMGYMRLLAAQRMRHTGEIPLHFMAIQPSMQNENQINVAVLPPPDGIDVWEQLPREETREEIIELVADTLPSYVLTISEAWIVRPKTQQELATVHAFKAAHPTASLKEFPGACEILSLFLEGDNTARSYICEIKNGVVNWPPTIHDVDQDGQLGVLQGMWKEGYRRCFENAVED